MPTNHHLPTSPSGNTTRAWWVPVASLLACGLVASLVACGGGGGSSAGVGTGGTGSFAVGSISGLGSIIVNGVRYDDSSATVIDDDGIARSASDLLIGQVVEVVGSVSTDGLSGTATSVTYYSEVKGPIAAIDTMAKTLTMFGLSGQVVTVNAVTVFDNVSDLSALAVGNVIEVYGLPDASGAITATRIEREATSIGAYSGSFRVRGVVSGLVATSPGQRFTLGTVTVQVDNSTQVSGTIADGVFVKVRLNKTAAGDGSYTAERVQVKSRTYSSDAKKAEIEGLVSEFTSASAPFKVNGYPAQLDPAVVYEHGTASNLVDGARIEAKGAVTNGVLIVSKVQFEDESDDGGSDGSSAPFEFHGTATCSATPCDTPAGSVTVRGMTVQYDASTNFGTGLDLNNLNGARVEVKAIAQSGSGGTTLLATRIKLDD